MGLKNNGQRIFILVIVVIFFLTSLSVTGFVLLDQIRNKGKGAQASSQADLQKQLQEQINKQKADPTADSANKENKLQGTKLANFTPVEKTDTLQKIDIKEGTGEVVQPGATVTAHYTGAVAKDGTIFQSSYDSGNPIPFSLSGVIKGWTDGVPGMKVGGTRRLVIPAADAYGANPPAGSNIPPNADLVFDIVLVKIGE